MRAILGLLVLAATSIVLPLHVNAQALWGGTKYGMSLDQVKAIVPGTVTPADPSHLGTGVQEGLRLRNVEIVNKSFTARFYFEANKLTQVTLGLDLGRPFGFDEAALVFESIADALRTKYGTELSREIKKGLLNVASATWLAGSTNIDLLAVAVGDGNAVLNINYQTRLAREAGKL